MPEHRHSGSYKSKTPTGKVVYKAKPIHSHKAKEKISFVMKEYYSGKLESSSGKKLDPNDQADRRVALAIAYSEANKETEAHKI